MTPAIKERKFCEFYRKRTDSTFKTNGKKNTNRLDDV